MLSALVEQVNEVDRWMPAIVAMIGSTGVVLSILIPILMSSRKKASTENQATREQITNGHSEHIRETLDRHQRETVKAISGVEQRLGDRIEGVHVELRDIRKHGAVQDDRLLDLEKTGPSAPKRRPARRRTATPKEV